MSNKWTAAVCSMYAGLALWVICATPNLLVSQPIPPDVKPKPPTPIVVPKVAPAKVSPLHPKGGELLVITTDAAEPYWDVEGVFAVNTFHIHGKALVVAIPKTEDDKTYLIRCIYAVDGKITVEKVTVKVPGTNAPVPVDPPLDGSLASLTAAVNALTKTVNGMDKRITALEQNKPPVPIPVPDAFQTAIQAAWEKDGKPASVSRLASLYKLAIVPGSGVLYTAKFAKEKELLDYMHSAAQSVLEEPDITKVTVLPNVRRALAAEFNASIGG